jgi:hypothetical protein
VAGYFSALVRSVKNKRWPEKTLPVNAAWNELLCRLLMRISAGAQYIWGFRKGHFQHLNPQAV